MDIIHRQQDGVAVLTLEGNLHCGAAESELKHVLTDLARRGCYTCVIDLKDVPHLDTTCLGVLIAAHQEFLRHGGGVRLVRTPARIQHVLSIAKLDTVLVTFPSENEAVRSFERTWESSVGPPGPVSEEPLRPSRLFRRL